MNRYQGIMLTATGCAATMWLAVTKQLTLYINPRYVIFTAVMALLGLLFVVAGIVRKPQTGYSTAGQNLTSIQTASCLVVAGVCICAFVVFIVLKPATLTSASLKQRGINSSLGTAARVSNAVPLFGGGDYTHFGVKDWAGLLAQTSDPEFYNHKPADITGFVSPDESDPQNLFYVSRFVITCCAVDARPVGVAVYAPHWQAEHKPDSWVRVTGAFTANPSAKGVQPVVLRPASITSIAQPEDPYVF